MKKIAFSLVALSIVAITVLFVADNRDKDYINHVKDLQSSIPLDGPGKSYFRDLMMTMNSETGKVPKQNIPNFIRSKSRASVSNTVDFNWEQVDSDIAGRVRSIMVDPNDGNKLWAGAVTGGLWYTPDFRNNAAWVPISDDWESLSIACMTYDPNNTQVFYVGTGESYTSVNIYRESSSSGVGIYKSQDGGNTWSLLGSTADFDYVNDIVVRDEDGQSVIYVAVASGIYQGEVFNSSPSDGLYRSEDGGQSWTQVLPNIAGSTVPYAVSDIELTPSGDIYVGTMRNLILEGGGYILNSGDGLTWNVEDRHVTQLEADFGPDIFPGRVKLASGGDYVYAVATGGEQNDFGHIRDHADYTRLMRLESGSWVDLENPPGGWSNIPWHALAIEVDPNNADRIVLAALDGYALSNASEPGSLSWVRVSDWAGMYHFSDYQINYYGYTDSDSILNHFIHADIHSIHFVNGSSDEILFSNDGGVHYSNDFSKSFGIPVDDRLDEYATLRHINNSFSTTQYYTVALNPTEGNNEVLAGTQDNGTLTSEDGYIDYKHLIGAGDGAFSFFDRDDPNIRFVSSYVNRYRMYIYDIGWWIGYQSGTFINPGDYDDRSNVIYANMMVDGGFEVLYPEWSGRYMDSLLYIDVNHILGTDLVGEALHNFVELGTNSTVAFSAVKVSPHDPGLDATLVLGNQLGDVFVVTGMPYSPSATKIDNDQLPVGYISAVDIGSSNDDILITFSNYGTSSVWHTNDGGANWKNLERNLPDIPVRDGLFNPENDDKLLIATEVGIWGLKSISDKNENWIEYNEGLPNVRVDAIDVRESDRTIAAATHGRGVFMGTYNQNFVPDPAFEIIIVDNSLTIQFDASASSDRDDDDLTFSWDFGDGNSGSGQTVSHTFDVQGSYEITLEVDDGRDVSTLVRTIQVDKPLGTNTIALGVYPNPTTGIIYFQQHFNSVHIYSINGRLLEAIDQPANVLDLSTYQKGIYLIEAIGDNRERASYKVVRD